MSEMCSICEGATSLSEGEMPCAKQLEQLGFGWQQAMGEGPANLAALQALGVLPKPPQPAQDTWASMTYGIYRGRREDLLSERKRRWRGILLAIGLTFFGIVAGAAISYGMPQIFGPIC